MSDKEEFQKFILYGIEKETPFKECIKFEVIFLFLFMLAFVIETVSERQNYVFLTLFLLPALFYLISAIILKQGKTIRGVHNILYTGITAGCLSFLFGLPGLEMLLYLFDGKERIIMICIAGAGYVFMSILCVYIIRRSIKKRKYSLKKGGAVSVSISCVLLGQTVAKTFFKHVDDKTAMEIVCMLAFIISYLSFIGLVNIFKYQYITKHPEILDVKKTTNDKTVVKKRRHKNKHKNR